MKLLALTLSCFLLSACSGFMPPQEAPGSGSQSDEPQLKLASNFASIRQNIIMPKCARCHNPNSSSDAHKILFSSEDQLLSAENDEGKIVIPGNALESAFFKVMNSDVQIRGDLEIMPPEKAVNSGRSKPVTADEMKVVEIWINTLANSAPPAAGEAPPAQILPPPPTEAPPAEALPIPETPEGLSNPLQQVTRGKCLDCPKSRRKSEVFSTQAGQKFKKVLIIVLENTDYKEALHQPYLQALTAQGALLQDMSAMVHPSQGNYISLLGGDSFQIKNDDPVNINQKNLLDLMEANGYSWKAYVEDYPGNCFIGATSGRYVRKHNPAISFSNISQNPSRCANIQEAKAFDQDAATGNLPNFSIFSPNMDDDGHDTGDAFASNWLQKNFATRFADATFMKDLLVVITFDESASKAGNHIYTVLLGSGVVPGSQNTQALNHISLLKTIETEFHLGDLGRLDSAAQPIVGIWK